MTTSPGTGKPCPPSAIPAAARVRIALLVTLTWWNAETAARAQPQPGELKQFSVEELMEIDVTLAARRPEPIGTAAAAMTVITREDIRRSGVTTIADAIALADGLHVARFNNGTWAISARGFNQNTANKLLVMVDGRTVYSPLFSGVFWNTIDYVLEDLDRIEVIRGPGATLWGANAVNGVINIVTRSARETTGTFASVVSGNEDPAVAEVRHGATAGAAAWRAYGKYARRDNQKFATGESAQDPVNRAQAGFRIDAGARGGRAWLLKGDVFHSWFGFADRPDGEFTDINLQTRAGWALSRTSQLDAGAYYRREYRRVPRQLTHHIDVFDADVQHVVAARRQTIVWGGGVRVNTDRTEGSTLIRFDPPARTYPVVSAFVEDQIAVTHESLRLTAGLKVEHNAFSGADWQPNVRARWLLPARQVVWGSAARAARRPTRFDDDIVASAANGVVLVRGSDAFESEELNAFEAGYRARPYPVLSIDVVGFWHDYDKLRSQEAPLPLTVGNTLNGRSAGFELAVKVQPVPAWRTHVSVTRLDTAITRDAGSRDVSGGSSESNDPRHLFSLRTALDLGDRVEVDGFLRQVGAVPNPAVPAFTMINARIAWRPTVRLELALIGQDLAEDRHPEFGPPGPARIEFERSVRIALAVRMP